MEKTKSPPAIVTVGAILLVAGLWALTSGNEVIGAVALVLAVLCGILWAAGDYIKRRD